MASMSNPLVCAPIECETMEEMAASMVKAKAEGANIVELCTDSLSLIHISEVESLIKLRALPAIVSFRLQSSSIISKTNSKATCLDVMRLALELEVEFIELDYEVVIHSNPRIAL